LVLVSGVLVAQAPESFEDCMKPTRPARKRLAREIEAWHSGQPLPAESLRYERFCGCNPLTTDSEVIIREANNYAFVLALATHAKAHPAVAEMAINRALLLRGPTQVFADLGARYRAAPGLLTSDVHKRAQARLRRRNVWVRGMDVEPAAFRRAGFREEQATFVLEEIARRLRGGEDWRKLYDEYSRRYRGKDGYTLLSDFSSYVTSEGRDEENAGLELLVPTYHLPQLLGAHAGDVLILPVKSGAYGFPIGFGPFLLLWQVREIYEPGQPSSLVPRATGAPFHHQAG
jgi:hypothetical protein